MVSVRRCLPFSVSISCPVICLAALTLACAATSAQTGRFPSGAVNFGSVVVNTGTPATATLTFTFTTGGTIAAPAVVTKGAKNLDFTDAGTGTCTTNGTSHIYNANDTCTVVVNFAPKYAGTRYGAAVLYDSSDKEIATGYVYGTGTGPQVAFSPSSEVGLDGGLPFPGAVAVDGNGNVYVAVFGDGGDGGVIEIPSGCVTSTCTATLGGGFLAVAGVAVDGAGTIYVSDVGNSSVEEMSPRCASASCVTTLGGGFGYPYAVAVDGSGNVYVTDFYSADVKEIPPGCASTSCVSTLGGGFSFPTGVAVNGSGTLYVADEYNNAIKMIPAGCTSSACVTKLGGTFDMPYGVALDGMGNIYVGGRSVDGLYEMPATCASSSCVTTLGTAAAPFGLAVDGQGNIYFGSYNLVGEVDRADPPGLAFAMTADGQTSTDSPQTVMVQNIGNQPLAFPVLSSSNNPAISANFSLNSGVTNACPLVGSGSNSTGTLAADASCNLPVSFTPADGANGNISGWLAMTDDTSNAAAPDYATQSIALTGMAGPAVVLTVAKQGLGTGTVTSSPAGISCGTSCSAIFAAPGVVILTPTADSGSYITSWGGCDSSSGVRCTVTMTTAKAVTVTFSKPPLGSNGQPIDVTTRSTTAAQADTILFTGWAADPQMGAPVSKVTVLIDGTEVGNSTLGIARPDVATAYHNVSYYNSGWTFTYPASGFAIGNHTATAVAYDSLGLSTQLQTRPFTVAATPSWGPPFGSLEGAVDATTRSSTVAQSDSLLVSGWAADPHDGAPVSSVSILIDGTAVGAATLGIARPDVVAWQKNSAYLHSGWTFTDAASGLSLGTHTVTAVATDSLGNSTTFPARTITVATAPVDGPPFGSLDKAVDATTGLTTVSQADNLFVSGWAADVHDGAPVHQVSILIDGTGEGNAALGFARLDVANKKDSAYTNSGWRFTMSASSLSAGTHTVTAVATDSLGLTRQFQIAIITVTP